MKQVQVGSYVTVVTECEDEEDEGFVLEVREEEALVQWKYGEISEWTRFDDNTVEWWF